MYSRPRDTHIDARNLVALAEVARELKEQVHANQDFG
jgi:hypothetical protein